MSSRRKFIEKSSKFQIILIKRSKKRKEILHHERKALSNVSKSSDWKFAIETRYICSFKLLLKCKNSL